MMRTAAGGPCLSQLDHLMTMPVPTPYGPFIGQSIEPKTTGEKRSRWPEAALNVKATIRLKET